VKVTEPLVDSTQQVRVNKPSQPLVSIVTPVYNEAEHLGECIESVLAQTYQNWDCTIVDNCSTDGSAEVARHYAAKDGRIRILRNQEFLRAYPNHNVAMRQISPASKYCKMVFADDWMFPECLEKMVEVAEEHPSVGIVGAFSLQDERVMWAGLPYPSRLVAGREICRRLFLEGLYVLGSATCVLYRADLVRSHDPFYNESNFHADMESCLVLLKASDFGFVHQVLTFQRVRSGSLAAISSEINTYAPGMLHALLTHGKDFLSSQEFETCRKRAIADYYAMLGGGFLRGRDKRFWDFHKKKLAEAGVDFSRVRLATVMLAKFGTALLDPRRSLDKARQIAREVSQTSRAVIPAKETRS